MPCVKDIEVSGNEDNGRAFGAQAHAAGKQVHLRIVIGNGILHDANTLRSLAGDQTSQ